MNVLFSPLRIKGTVFFLSLPTSPPNPVGLSGETATDPQLVRIETLKVCLKQTKQLVGMWLDVPQDLDETYGSYVAIAACPTPADYMSVSHPSIH